MARTAVRGRLTWQVARVDSVVSETDAVRYPAGRVKTERFEGT